MPTQSKSEMMAERRRKAKQSERFNTNQQILITQVVGSVMPDEGAGQTILSAAYQVAAEFIQNNANGQDHIDLTWEINGDHFNAQYYPKRDKAVDHGEAQEAGEAY